MARPCENCGRPMPAAETFLPFRTCRTCTSWLNRKEHRERRAADGLRELELSAWADRDEADRKADGFYLPEFRALYPKNEI